MCIYIYLYKHVRGYPFIGGVAVPPELGIPCYIGGSSASGNRDSPATSQEQDQQFVKLHAFMLTPVALLEMNVFYVKSII